MKHRLLQALALNVLISASGIMALPFVDTVKNGVINTAKRKLLRGELHKEVLAVGRMRDALTMQEHEKIQSMIKGFANIRDSVTATMTEEEIVEKMNQVFRDHGCIDLEQWRIAAEHKYGAVNDAFKLACNNVKRLDERISSRFKEAAENYDRNIGKEEFASDQVVKQVQRFWQPFFTDQAIEKLASLKAQTAT